MVRMGISTITGEFSEKRQNRKTVRRWLTSPVFGNTITLSLKKEDPSWIQAQAAVYPAEVDGFPHGGTVLSKRV